MSSRGAPVVCPTVITTFGSTETGHVCAGRYGEYVSIPLAIGEIAPDVEYFADPGLIELASRYYADATDLARVGGR